MKIKDVDELLYRGFMPELYRAKTREPRIFYRDYLETYIEKDLRQMIKIKDLNAFIRFLKLLAGRVGQIVNMSGLSGEVGVSSTTLSEWMSVLEASFVIFRLPPYFSNVSKQIIKSPKIYFTEPGLICYLLGINDKEQVTRDPLRGQIFENMVVVEALKARYNENLEPNLFYMRTGKGVEVDLIIEEGRNLYPYEIKSAMTPISDFAKNINVFCSAEENAKNPTIIYSGEESPSFYGVKYLNFRNVGEDISKMQ